MSILTLSNLGFAFGDFDVFLGINASIPNDGKVGLVGPNGIGKTTLLRLIAGLGQPSIGSVHRARGTRIGYLAQEAVDAFAGHHNTVHDEMLTVFAGLRAQEENLRTLEARMAHEPHEELMAEYSAAQEAFEHAGGYDYEMRIRQVLYGLGFDPSDWDQPLGQLSGGQKTRALLARLLLERPDLLILDEPTNHLDFQAVEWLEGLLKTWDGALLVVSHDRYFLDNVVEPHLGDGAGRVRGLLGQLQRLPAPTPGALGAPRDRNSTRSRRNSSRSSTTSSAISPAMPPRTRPWAGCGASSARCAWWRRAGSTCSSARTGAGSWRRSTSPRPSGASRTSSRLSRG